MAKKSATPDGSQTTPAVGLVDVGGGADGTMYDPPLRALRIGTAGTTLKVTDLQDNDVTIPDVKAGEVIHAYIKQVFATGTNATGMTGYY